MCEKAEFIASQPQYKNQIKKLGLTEESVINFGPDPSLAFEASGHQTEEDSEIKSEDESPAAIDTTSLLPTSGRPNITNELTQDMITEITKNPRRELKGVIDSILNLATTEEKNQHLWNVLQFLHQDMLTLTRHNEKKKGVSGDMC